MFLHGRIYFVLACRELLSYSADSFVQSCRFKWFAFIYTVSDNQAAWNRSLQITGLSKPFSNQFHDTCSLLVVTPWVSFSGEVFQVRYEIGNSYLTGEKRGEQQFFLQCVKPQHTDSQQSWSTERPLVFPGNVKTRHIKMNEYLWMRDMPSQHGLWCECCSFSHQSVLCSTSMYCVWIKLPRLLTCLLAYQWTRLCPWWLFLYRWYSTN